ncbi:hypothetical protein KR51_00036060 [Rubidibacter lacunae KORDI 51-2]|uniref:Uncharacterized protein n=1 Tax=Rubidibacter lacunae KORDI 51-2 TaxID=582515 RepID=U5DE60_9CHRO|nr:hypothetical protein KR51_00036060 [Rubidibacter lacunae KORDI 51-2]
MLVLCLERVEVRVHQHLCATLTIPENQISKNLERSFTIYRFRTMNGIDLSSALSGASQMTHTLAMIPLLLQDKLRLHTYLALYGCIIRI